MGATLGTWAVHWGVYFDTPNQPALLSYVPGTGAKKKLFDDESPPFYATFRATWEKPQYLKIYTSEMPLSYMCFYRTAWLSGAVSMTLYFYIT